MQSLAFRESKRVALEPRAAEPHQTSMPWVKETQVALRALSRVKVWTARLAQRFAAE